MNGELEDPCGTITAVQLAQIAAPFVAAGMTNEDALAKAFTLFRASSLHLFGVERRLTSQWFDDVLTATRAQLPGLLGVKTERRAKQLLFEALPNDQAESLWESSSSGQPTFPREVIETLKQWRKRKHLERGRAATEAREPPLKKKRTRVRRKK